MDNTRNSGPERPLRVVFFSTLRQFGHRIDPYEYCKHLRGTCEVTYYSLDFGLRRIELPGVHVVYQQRPSNRVVRYIVSLSQLIRFVRAGSFDVLFFEYFYFCSIVQLFVRPTACVLDVRTGGVDANEARNAFYNFCIRIEQTAFRHVTVISEGLRALLHMPRSKAHILPLGADGSYAQMPAKEFSVFRMLYVGGIAEGRNLDRMVRGVLKFLESPEASNGARLDIVGDGPDTTMHKLRTIVQASPARERVQFHGFLPHDELVPFFERCNVGLNYIPMTPYFDHQPPTKLFEYGMSGMLILSTATTENAKYVSSESGILVGDSVEEVERGIRDLWSRRNQLSSSRIKELFKDFTWEKIVLDNLLPYLRSTTQQ